LRSKDLKTKRDELVVTLITKAVASALGDMFAWEMQLVGAAPLTALIVMDEFGSYPEVVRELCSACGDKFGVHIKLIVVRTGTDAHTGSLPSSFVAARMPAAAPMLERLKTTLSAKFCGHGACGRMPDARAQPLTKRCNTTQSRWCTRRKK
jgi:hypothetical protein